MCAPARKRPATTPATPVTVEKTLGACRVAVDIGGTFTDVVLQTGARQVPTKVLTTADNPAVGVVQGLRQVLERAGREPADVGMLLHGTTLATNALIERRGARTALVTTGGHRDVLEMALENRFEQYDVNVDRPVPLVPRRWRLTVPERVNAAGEVLTPLNVEAVQALVPALAEGRIESVAVGFLHGYANGAHERLVRDVLAAALPDISITLASEVCPEIREFERFSTACANAYVKPLMSRYLADMQVRLAALGVRSPFLMMTSGGGLTSVAAARSFPSDWWNPAPREGRFWRPASRPRLVLTASFRWTWAARRRRFASLTTARRNIRAPSRWIAATVFAKAAVCRCGFRSSKWWKSALAAAPSPRWTV